MKDTGTLGTLPAADAAGVANPCQAQGLFTPAVAELVAIGAAIAANCEPCLRYHTGEAAKLGVSQADMARAVEMGAKVKDAPHRSIMRLAARLTQTDPAPAAKDADACFSGEAPAVQEAAPCGCSKV